jgi:hypothetical protein
VLKGVEPARGVEVHKASARHGGGAVEGGEVRLAIAGDGGEHGRGVGVRSMTCCPLSGHKLYASIRVLCVRRRPVRRQCSGHVSARSCTAASQPVAHCFPPGHPATDFKRFSTRLCLSGCCAWQITCRHTHLTDMHLCHQDVLQ